MALINSLPPHCSEKEAGAEELKEAHAEHMQHPAFLIHNMQEAAAERMKLAFAVKAPLEKPSKAGESDSGSEISGMSDFMQNQFQQAPSEDEDVFPAGAQ